MFNQSKGPQVLSFLTIVWPNLKLSPQGKKIGGKLCLAITRQEETRRILLAEQGTQSQETWVQVHFFSYNTLSRSHTPFHHMQNIMQMIFPHPRKVLFQYMFVNILCKIIKLFKM